jgi:hypothetical protein
VQYGVKAVFWLRAPALDVEIENLRHPQASKIHKTAGAIGAKAVFILRRGGQRKPQLPYTDR